MKSFEEIGKNTGTDKITHHGYHRFYPIFLDKYRKCELSMLEIGTEKDKSIKLWEEYFPFSKIYGIDIENEYKFSRGEVFKGDQSDIKFLKEIITKIGKKIKFIIDDGSHKPEHQLKTFIFLFNNLLEDGGIYIIEDIETNYWKKGKCYGNTIKKGYKHKMSLVEIFKEMIDKLNEEFIKDKSIFKTSLIPKEIQDNIGLISFQYNSIIIIKKDAKFYPYNNREYRFKKNL